MSLLAGTEPRCWRAAAYCAAKLWALGVNEFADVPRTEATSDGEIISARNESALAKLSYRCCCWSGHPWVCWDCDGDAANCDELFLLPLMLVGMGVAWGLISPPPSTVNLPFLLPPPLDVRQGFTVILLLEPAAA